MWSENFYFQDIEKYIPVNNVSNTVGNQDVSSDNLGAVDKNVSVLDPDVQVGALEGGDGAIGNVGAVDNLAGDHVVSEDAAQLLGGQAGDEVADGGKGIVGGDEDGEVGSGVEDILDSGLADGAKGGRQVRGEESVGDVGGEVEDAVDHVDCAAGVVDVLKRV